MLSLSSEAPDFVLEGVAAGQVRWWRLHDIKGWVVLFFYPADFTFVCPTEVLGFERRLDDFARCGASVLAVGVDDLESHREWAQELGGIRYPLLSDPERNAVRAYGVLNEEDGRPFRATFVIAPQGRIAYTIASPANVGRSVDETLRVLSALQTGRLCPADWKPGEPTGHSASGY